MQSEIAKAEQAIEKMAVGIVGTMEDAERLMRLSFPAKNDPLALESYRKDYAEADRVYNELHRAWKSGEDERVKFTGPLNEVLRRINEVFKRRLDPLDKLKKGLNLTMKACANAELRWQRAEQERADREARKKLEDEQLAKAQKAAEAGMDSLADRILDKPIEPVKTEPVRTAMAESRSTASVRFSARVVDAKKFLQGVVDGKVNMDYVTIDEAQLRRQAQSMKGQIEWPGVEVFEDVQIGAGR